VAEAKYVHSARRGETPEPFMISFRSFLPVAAAAACVPSTRHESQATQACSAAAAGETALAPGGWSEAERVDLGGEFSDLYPTLTHDGQRLAFTSYRPFPGDTSAHPSANLWYADRRGDGWATPVPITSAVRPGYYHSQVWFGPGDSLIFRATTPDWETTTTLVSVRSGTGYAAPVPYEPVDGATTRSRVDGAAVARLRPRLRA
jgi:hypothetical protein